MAKRSVVWTETAVRQRREILSYWTKRNGSTKYAEKLIEITKAHLSVVASSPNAFQESEMDGIRVSAMGHFSIFYKEWEGKILVMAFWDNRQDPEKLWQVLKEG